MSLYNLDYLKKISNNDNQFIREILSTFIESAEEVVYAISTTKDISEYQQLSRIIHKFIPSLNFVGVKNMEEDLNKLEIYLANQQHLDDLPRMLEDAKNKLNQVIQEITEEQLQ